MLAVDNTKIPLDCSFKSSSIRGAPQNTESFDDAPKKASNRLIMHPKALVAPFFILSDECLELPSDSVKKGITLKRFEKQCTVSSERCRGMCISRACGTLPIPVFHRFG